MAGWFTKNKSKILITILTTVLLVIAILVGVKLYNDNLGNNTIVGTGNKDDDIQTEYEFKHMSYESQGTLADPDDVGVWISDCDAASSFTNITGALFTSYDNTYVQGKGAMNLVNLKYNSMMIFGTFKPVDISKYKSIHISLYINNPKYLNEKNITLELNSSGKYDVEEIAWGISPEKLKVGWNELYLDMNAASVMPTADLTRMCYFRIYSSGAGVGMRAYMDAMYATNTEPNFVKDPVKLASTKDGYILDFDSLEGLSSSGKLTLITDKNKCKDGAAVQIEDPTDVWIRTALKTIDLSAYKEGKFKLWLYVNDASLLKKESGMTIELTSSGESDKNEISWSFGISHLKTGWNKLNLSFSSANKSSKEEIDWTKVNFLRIYGTNCDSKLVFTIDGGSLWAPGTRVPADGMIISGDTLDDFASTNGVVVTKADGEYKQGTGALKKTVSQVLWMHYVLNDRVDVSSFGKGGIHAWLYVDDVSKLTSNVYFEIGSAGVSDQDEYQWLVAGLKSGWNEIRLPFKDAAVAGAPNLGKINFCRVYGEVSGEITVLLDDVRAIQDTAEIVPDGTTVDTNVDGMIFSADSLEYVKLYSGYSYGITREEGEYLQGTGAFKMMGAGAADRIRLQAVLKEARDLSKYKDGGIQLSIYLKNKSEFVSTAMTMELTSSGQPDADEMGFRIDLAGLKEGWNTITLPFKNASMIGTFDYSAVNFLRIYASAVENSQNIVMIIDDVHAVEKVENEPEEPGISVEGIILDCDSLQVGYVGGDQPISVTTNGDSFKQGTGAFTGTGKGSVWIETRLNKAVDITEYEEGYLSFWLYVSDASLVDGSKMRVQIGSEGTYDGPRYNWNMSDVTIADGWNRVYLDLQANTIGMVDLSHINYFRIFQNGGQSSALTYIIDDVHAVITKQTETNAWYIVNKDTTISQANYSKADCNLDLSECEEKNLKLYITMTLSEQMYETLSATGYHLAIEVAQTESDHYEYQWWKVLRDIPLKAGKNVIELSWTAAGKSGENKGAATLEGTLNWFRIYCLDRNYANGVSLNGIVINEIKVVDTSAERSWTTLCSVLSEEVTIPNVNNRTWDLTNLNVNLGKTDEEIGELALYVKLNLTQSAYTNLKNNAVLFKVEMAKERTDYNEFEWTVPFDDIPLQAGEVVMLLPWTDAEKKSKDGGASTVEKTLNYFRLFTNDSAGGAPWNVLTGIVVEEIKVMEISTETE